MPSTEQEIKKRVLEEASYLITHNSTVRATAHACKISKSTVHTDLRKRLPHFSQKLSKKVNKILEKNKEERAIRGGIATQKKKDLMKKSFSHKI